MSSQMITQICSVIAIICGSILLGSEFGTKIGIVAGLFGWALMPRGD